jgi:DNA polymerase III subunit epsilon
MELRRAANPAQLVLDLDSGEQLVASAPLALVTAAGLTGLPIPRCAEPPADALVAELSYAVVDVETTGTRAWFGDRVTEVAAVSVRGGEVCGCYETLVNPGIPLSPWITQLTGITNAMVAGAPRFPSVCGDFLERLEGAVFVAHNARFDWAFVSMEVERATGDRPEAPVLCTVRLARVLLPHLRRRSLDFLANHYRVGIEARHRAAGDAIATAHVLTRMLADAADRGVERWGELTELVSPRPRRKARKGSAFPQPASDDSYA